MRAPVLDSIIIITWRNTTVRLFPPPTEFYVYQLHFRQRFHHAAHYTGATCNLSARLALHRAGRGARLLKAVVAAGINFDLARLWKFPTWQEAREWERHIKAQHNAVPRCPLCQHTPVDELVFMRQGHSPLLTRPIGKRQPMGEICPRFVRRARNEGHT